ncbi:MAG: M4 family metallopeptidase, partial [Candidatus Promineifilaceae bacterium]
ENVNGIAIRSMKEPGTAYDDPVLGRDPQPGHMDDYVVTVEDAGGVHINSGILNHAFYLTAIELGGYAWEKAGQIWYTTSRDKLFGNADFNDFARLTHTTAGELYGIGSLEQQAVRFGWQEVGLSVGFVEEDNGGDNGNGDNDNPGGSNGATNQPGCLDSLFTGFLFRRLFS